MSNPVIVYQGWLVTCDRCSFSRGGLNTEEQAREIGREHAPNCPSLATAENPAYYRRLL